MRERIGFRSLPRFSDDPLVAGAFWLLAGYLLLGRSFAQIGLPAVNVFLGEVLLILMFLGKRVRRARSVGGSVGRNAPALARDLGSVGIGWWSS